MESRRTKWRTWAREVGRYGVVRSTLRTNFRRAQNRWWDLRAALAGYCNDRPWSPEDSRGAYSHWRCALRRGHDGDHRAKNYVWSDGTDRVRHAPIPVLGLPTLLPGQPWERSLTLSRRDGQRLNAWIERRRRELADA